VGKDLASLAEIWLAATCFTMTFFPMAHTFATVSDLFALGFSTLYCVWGMNHIFAICFQPQSAVILGVTASFVSFLFSGVKPAAHKLAGSMGGYGSLLLLVSPIRWAMTQWIFRQITGQGSTYTQDIVRHSVGGHFNGQGYNLNDLECPDHSSTVLERWMHHKGYACHSGQLFLLGFLFRFVAAVCVLFSASAKASGGQLPLGITSNTRSRMLRDAIVTFIVFFFLLELLVLGQTH